MNVIDLVKKYPKVFSLSEDQSINKNYLFVPKGWIPVLDIMLSCIQSRIDNYSYVHNYEIKNCPQVVCNRMKEKFGSLVFDHTGGDGVTEGMINMTISLLEHICCICGTTENIGMTVEYISTCCKDCFDDGKAPGETWKSFEEIEKLANGNPTDGSEQS